MAPRAPDSQKASKRPPRGPQEAPKRPQEASKRTPKGTRTNPNPPSRLQQRTRWLRNPRFPLFQWRSLFRAIRWVPKQVEPERARSARDGSSIYIYIYIHIPLHEAQATGARGPTGHGGTGASGSAPHGPRRAPKQDTRVPRGLITVQNRRNPISRRPRWRPDGSRSPQDAPRGPQEPCQEGPKSQQSVIIR